MSAGPDKLKEIAELLSSDKAPEPVTVRTFLSWFGAQRRGFYIVQYIREELQKAGLQTDPDFEYEYIDGLIQFRLAQAHSSGIEVGVGDAHVLRDDVSESVDSVSGATVESTSCLPNELPQVPVMPASVVTDPTYRIGKLAAANRAPVSVKPDSTISEAATLMMINDFSQLPVMQSEITLKGVVSWSSIGAKLALGLPADKVTSCMDHAVERSSEDSLFAIIDDIVKHQYVLIRGKDNKIKGIVTTSDLSWQFGQLAEPFLLIGEIEQHIRLLISGKYLLEELKAACDPEEQNRDVTGVQDLTFGEYIRLLENPSRWAKLDVQIDRGIFIEQLQSVRKIRNDVMHFDPDGITEEERETLRKAVHFLQVLQQLGAFKSDHHTN